MQYFKLNNGENIPSLGFSTYNIKNDEVYNLMKNAISLNYRLFFITRESYPFAKKAIEEAIKDGILREDFFICAKFYTEKYVPEDIKNSIVEILRALNLKYLDLFLIHLPILYKTPLEMPETEQGFIPLDKVPISNVLQEVRHIKNEGFIKSVGVSNFSIERIEDFKSNFKVVPNANEIECQSFMGEENLVEYSLDKNVQLICNFQTCKENFFKKYEKSKVLNSIAKKYQIKEFEALYVWLRQNDACVLPKIASVEELKRNLDLENLKLSNEDVAAITTELK